MGPKGKQHSKGKSKDRPKESSDSGLSHTVGQAADSPKIPLEVEQLMLNVFRDALSSSTDTNNLREIIQEIKGHLYERNFAMAFSTELYLEGYALRWSASRALAYANVFAGLYVDYSLLGDRDAIVQDSVQDMRRAQILCVGGGAGAEIVALAVAANVLSLPQLSVTAVDVADWSAVIGKVSDAITKPPLLSKYASAAKKDANQALLDSARMDVSFKKQDILECSAEELQLLAGEASLVTIMFTLNELFSASIAKTTSFLLNLTEAMEPGSGLLIVDSPGSYSEVSLGVNNVPKQYPMKWLLDHTLQNMAGDDSNGVSKWEKCVTDDSRWFRISNKLKYPLKLENMRYQIHFYQRRHESHGIRHASRGEGEGK